MFLFCFAPGCDVDGYHTGHLPSLPPRILSIHLSHAVVAVASLVVVIVVAVGCGNRSHNFVPLFNLNETLRLEGTCWELRPSRPSSSASVSSSCPKVRAGWSARAGTFRFESGLGGRAGGRAGGGAAAI